MERKQSEHVDHDHMTGEVRGVLCFNCNQALGNARDDIVVLQGLIDYLNRYRLALLRRRPTGCPASSPASMHPRCRA